ncbi:hypothetical protein ElyMa_002253700 [Elysia marginata]|uniref:Uncharacterized protein n=1 Tax=Elysia marginata TaxID=1093978 RepID=A0AAV4FY12_9GAST|nr:hypothetical protein ElyMa_002253700 [Elysia marginata]
MSVCLCCDNYAEVSRDTRGGSVPPVLQVFITSRFFATGTFQNSVGEMIGVFQPTDYQEDSASSKHQDCGNEESHVGPKLQDESVPSILDQDQQALQPFQVFEINQEETSTQERQHQQCRVSGTEPMFQAELSSSLLDLEEQDQEPIQAVNGGARSPQPSDRNSVHEMDSSIEASCTSPGGVDLASDTSTIDFNLECTVDERGRKRNKKPAPETWEKNVQKLARLEGREHNSIKRRVLGPTCISAYC